MSVTVSVKRQQHDPGARRVSVKRSHASSNQPRWLLLVHALPPRLSNLRVKTWRRLRRLGAVAVKNSVYVLPYSEERREDFEWLKAEIEAMGGEASVFAARKRRRLFGRRGQGRLPAGASRRLCPPRAGGTTSAPGDAVHARRGPAGWSQRGGRNWRRGWPGWTRSRSFRRTTGARPRRRSAGRASEHADTKGPGESPADASRLSSPDMDHAAPAWR